jgi:hypothetical protein
MGFDTIDFSSANLERIDFTNSRIKILHNHISKVAKNAYGNQLLLSNAILAKSDLPLSALNNYLEGKEAGKISFLFCLKKVFLYFLKSYGWLFVFCFQSLAHRASRQKFIAKTKKPLTLIDIYLIPEKIAKTGELEDRFFPGLAALLESKGMSYAYAPKFSGATHPSFYYKMFRKLKEKNGSVISSFQLLNWSDYFKMFLFISNYLFQVFRQIKQLGGSREDRFLKFYLWNTIDHAAIKNFERKIFGEHISRLNVPAIKCISWYENQPQDKSFYKGLRLMPGKVKIYGAQLYLWPATLLNLHIDEDEINFGIIPDRILVNGTYYLRKENRLDLKIGPSMRYKKLFKKNVNAKDKTAFLVLLPFFENEIDEVLSAIEEAMFSNELLVKFHPATDNKKYRQRLKGKMRVVDGDIYKLFDCVSCVIGKSTGALIEATSLGIPVININIEYGISHDYLPEFGKGTIWQNASNGVEIAKWAKIFSALLQTKPNLINTIAEKHKEMFFCEPTNQRIDEAFELDDFINWPPKP